MQELLDVRERMGAVAGIGEVCRTLSTVAAAKLAQTRERAAGAREYAELLRGMADRQQRAACSAGIDPSTLSPLMESRDVGRAVVVVIGAERGLCGGYNVSACRVARSFAAGLEERGIELTLTTIGQRAETFMRRATDFGIGESIHWTREGVSESLIQGLLDRLVEMFTSGAADEVWVVYTAFLSAIQRLPKVRRLLPIAALEGSPNDVDPVRWFYDPDRMPCVEELLQQLIRLQVEDVLLESFASEQAARMVTMQEASERADRALQELRIRYNRLRREAITADLTGVLVAGRTREVASGA